MKKDDVLIHAAGLRKQFGSFVAVDGIDLSIKKGEIFGFLGPNGAGKSTTIKMLCGILPPSGGQGYVAGFDLFTERESIRRHIGYMSQKFSLYEELSVEENIEFFMGIYNVPKKKKKERKEWVLEMTGLKERGKAITKTLPTGFKQRLALGCAILHEPIVIFLDEPTSGTDPIMRRNFWALINDLAFSGKTLFVTTHYLDEAEYCKRLALIYAGRIIKEGTPRELKDEHMKYEVVEIEADPLYEGLDVLLKNEVRASLFGRYIHANLQKGRSQAEIYEMLKKGGVNVKKIETIPPSLEDVFITLIEDR